MPKKTWNEKLHDSKNLPTVVEIDCNFAAIYGPRMLVAAPLEFDEIMKRIPKGKLTTADRINTYLAKKHNADWTCFMTTGIFINLAAKASDERGGVDETPYWRTLKKGGELNDKFPGGFEGHKLLLETEGHKVFQKGKKYLVENYEQKLWEVE